MKTILCRLQFENTMIRNCSQKMTKLQKKRDELEFPYGTQFPYGTLSTYLLKYHKVENILFFTGCVGLFYELPSILLQTMYFGYFLYFLQLKMFGRPLSPTPSSQKEGLNQTVLYITENIIYSK